MILSLPPRLLRDLDLLRRMGLFGGTVEEVARDLIAMQIRALIEKKFLPLEWTEGEVVPAPVEQPVPVEQPAADWLTDERLAVIKAELAKGRRWSTILEMFGLPAGSAPTIAKFKSRLRALGIKPKVSEKVRAHLAAMRAKNPKVHPESKNGGVADQVTAPTEPSPPPPPRAPTLGDIARRAGAEIDAHKPVAPILVTSPAARQTVAGLASANSDPVMATSESIQRWGETRGIITRRLDLDRVNAVRRRLQLPPFAVEPVGVGISR